MWVALCATAVLGFVSPARALAPATWEALRIHRPDAADRVFDELTACEARACAERGSLALLAGYLYLSKGEAAKAVPLLSSASVPELLAPYRLYYLGQALFYSGDLSGAVAHFSAALASAPKELAGRARARLGETLLASEDAFSAWPYLEQSAEDLELPELYYQRSEARALVGDERGAQKDLKRLAIRFPTHFYGQQARKRLSDLSWTMEERVAQVKSFLAAGDNEGALQALELENVPAELKAPLALLELSALYDLGRDAAAEKAFKRATAGPKETAVEAWLLKAKRALKRDENAEARALFVQLSKRWPRARQAEEARFMIPWLDFQAGKLKEAAEGFERFEKRHPQAARRDEALAYSSLARMRRGEFSAAAEDCQRLLKKYPHSSLVPQAMYWSARAGEEAGRSKEEVETDYGQVIRLFPATFYAHLASARLREMKLPVPQAWRSRPTGAEVASPPALQLALALAQAGLLRDFRVEAWQKIGSIRGADQALQFGHTFLQHGDYGLAHAAASRALWAQAYAKQNGEALALFYPKAFQGVVEQAAQQNGISAPLIWSIMRRESHFRADVRSSADARGLMQLLSSTARAIAQKLGDPFESADRLFDPSTNIRLGSWYLGQLQARFAHPALVSAAYNAGPGPVLRWQKERRDWPLDLFVDCMPYRETRGYVKQVVADLFNYPALYGEVTGDLELTLPAAKPDGIDF
jgi:soluble lytic murein transglycosylase